MNQAETYSTMTEAVRALKARGFTADFAFHDGAFYVLDSARTFRPGDLRIVEHHRFEGMSDPDDMSVIYAIQATDGTRGTLVDAFGTYANAELGAALREVKLEEPR